MSLWIKICGNTSVEDALLSAEAGADAVGFVFAQSPRRVTAETVASIAGRLPKSVEKIGIFVDATFEQIATTVRESGLTGVQLHIDSTPDMAKRLREEFGPALRILRVLHYADGIGEVAVHISRDTNIDALLLDSRTAEAVGGTGLTFDWKSAGKSLSRNPEVSHRLVVAGGLKPANVADAISTLRPWGVDVVSGVEVSPGRKDAGKVRDFIAIARSASARLA
ncbi:phosphoribosylanthranilate isomerase [Telmatobacter sp. DSM 110680]|uniref:N-(5'-phosphoribosyl)anthranilate isomerase n=1 Tax=Telmatobacter sp. DSM 110680 TaxID=3036704 RepID=A0AAU7DP70_9BACT